MKDFEKWWHETGSGIPIVPFDDRSEHAERVAQRAWDAASDPIDQRLIEELWQRRTDAAEMNASIRQLLGNTEQLELTVARLTEDLNRMDAVTNILYASIEKRKLREEADYNNHQCRTTDGE